MSTNDLNPRKYNDAINAIYKEAKQEAINLLKEKGDKCFIALDDWKDETEAHCDDVTISIFGVGLNENGELLVAACVDNIGYGFGPDDFPQGFTSTDNLEAACFPDIYRFVANNIEESTTREEAEKVYAFYYGE